MRYTRKLLLFLAGRGKIDATDYQEALQTKIYTTLPVWQMVLRTGLLALGLGLIASAVLFLLAFNWEALTTAQQLGLAGTSVAVPVLLSITPLFAPTTQKMLLTLGAVMVGGLFAVFGQIYQTGANGYELFFTWLIFITLWTVLVDYPALWVVWLFVLNLTLFFYGDQQVENWRTYQMLGLMTIATGLALVAFVVRGRSRAVPYPGWFLNVIAIGVGVLGVAAVWSTSSCGPAVSVTTWAVAAFIAASCDDTFCLLVSIVVSFHLSDV